MKPGGYIKRYTRLKARRDRKRRSARQRDTEYMLRVKQLPCCGPMHPLIGHSSTIHAHHAGQRVAGRKADDDTTIPLCSWCHDCWHGAGGPFNGWTKDQRRSWADARIADTRRQLGHPGSEDVPERAGAYEGLEW